MDGIPVRRKSNEGVIGLNLQSQNSPAVELGQGSPRAKPVMDLAIPQEQTNILQRTTKLGATIFEIQSNNTKTLTHTFLEFYHSTEKYPLDVYSLPAVVNLSKRCIYTSQLSQTLMKSGFYFCDKNSPEGQYNILYESKKLNAKITCFGEILNWNDSLESMFSSVLKILEVVYGDQLGYRSHLQENCGFREIMFIQVISSNFNSIIDCFWQMTPTPLNSYLIYEILFMEFTLVAYSFTGWFPGIVREENTDLFDTIAIELRCLYCILEMLKPWAITVYEDLGYDKEDFALNDEQLIKIYDAFHLECYNVMALKRYEQLECREQPKLTKRSLELNTSKLERVVQPKEKKEENWDKAIIRYEQERAERKTTEAKKAVYEYKEAAKKTEEEKQTERIAATKVFYQVPSPKQFEQIYKKLSNGNQKVYNILASGKGKITSEDVSRVIKEIAFLMQSVLGIDQNTAQALIVEDNNRIHVAHDSSDKGKVLPENYLKIRFTTPIKFGCVLPNWKAKCADTQEALDICNQRKEDWTNRIKK